MRILKYTASTENQLVALVDDRSIPVDGYSSYYITSELCLDNHSINTMVKHVYELKFFLEWLQYIQIDIIDRVERGIFLSDSEVYTFVDAAKLKRSENFQDKDNVVSIDGITDKYVSNEIMATAAAKQRVDTKTTNGRVTMAACYIEFLSLEIHTGIMPDMAVEALNRTRVRLQNNKLRVSAHAAAGKKYDGFNSVLADESFQLLLNIIQPQSPKNPFKHSQIRNRLIVEILADTGIRRGALSKLKISDIDFTKSANRLYIRRSPEDPSDSRLHKPQQKTAEHSTYINPVLVGDIESYINNVRSYIPGALSHEFLFITEMDTKGTIGSPLSIYSIDYIFSTLSRAIGVRVSSHILRHKWNEVFTDKTAHLTDSEARKRRIDSMGWSKTSAMPERYNHFKDLQKAYSTQQDIQREILARRERDE